jgi:hypothetical protein
MGRVRAGTNTFPLGLVLAGWAWGVLVLLSLRQGMAPRVFSLALIAGHVRLLVAIPLFFLGETWVAPRMTEFVGNILDSGLVPLLPLFLLEYPVAQIAERLLRALAGL